MKRLAVSFLAVVFVGCGTVQSTHDPKVYRVDAEFTPYMDTFKTEAMNRYVVIFIPYLIMIFGDTSHLGSDVVGYCAMMRTTPRIVIQREFWDQATPQEKENLIFHELGHCVLDRDHTQTFLPDGRPESLMYDYLLDSGMYQLHRAYYLDELFLVK